MMVTCHVISRRVLTLYLISLFQLLLFLGTSPNTVISHQIHELQGESALLHQQHGWD